MFERIFKVIDKISLTFATLFTITMAAAIFIQVFFRYVLNDALGWPEEIGRYLFIWATYLGISISMAHNGHLRVLLLPDYLPPKPKKMLDIFCLGVCAVFFLTMTFLGGDMTLKVFDIGQLAISVPIPIFIVWAGIPVGCFLAFLQCLRNIRLVYCGSNEQATG
ncbi:TRAP transporter small permease [Desulfovibrio sp. OttesenSCG-928-C14]|nr:TRAP transporter small permease [Desulfovibrio sp. OttesenSCG-928-C14]